MLGLEAVAVVMFSFIVRRDASVRLPRPSVSANPIKEQLQILRLTTPELKKTFGAQFAQDDSPFWRDHGTMAVLISVERFISFSKTRLSS